MQGIESLGYEVKDQPLVPDGGMQQLKGAADLLAEFGRNGDTYVVHAAEGETVLPLEVLESNPKLKTMIYQQMEELGLQPERYVVGNEMNSLNPVTGQPEFFFKKLFKKIKKIGKKGSSYYSTSYCSCFIACCSVISYGRYWQSSR